MNAESRVCAQCGRESQSHARLCTSCQNRATLDSSAAPSGQTPAEADTILFGGESQSSPGLASESADSARSPATDFGDYELCEEIARGGMGVVFRARHKKLNRAAAIKMILAGQFTSQGDIQRFYVEAEAAARLDHPGIVPIYDIGEHEGRPYFAMKYIEGGSLAEHRHRIRRDVRGMVRMMAQVARAVHHAHQRGILHRDLKPANILLDKDDNPLLADLGLAKQTSGDSNLTQTGTVLGTPSYMPPEQAQAGSTLTTAADIYSLGAILYEMLTGVPPHQGTSAIDTVMRAIHAPIQPPRSIHRDIDRDLELICMKCLAREPDARFDTAADLAQDLEHWLSGEPISVRPPSVLAIAGQWIKRHRAIGLAVFALVGGCAFSLPIVLSILGTLDQPASLYAGTPADPRPLIYSFTNVPAWIPVIAAFAMLLLWPSLGAIVAIVTRPESWRTALLHGGIVGAASGMLFAILLGWVLFMMAAQQKSSRVIDVLAHNIWPDGGQSPQELEQRLMKLVPRLEEVAAAERADYLKSRVTADSMAQGPLIWLLVASIALLLGLPIAVGTVIAQILLSRPGRWWLRSLRYYVSWWMFAIGILCLTAAIGGGRVNGRRFSEYSLLAQLGMLAGFPLIGCLVIRPWRRRERPRN